MIDVLEALFDLELEELKHADEAIKHVGYAADGFGLIVKQSANICCVTRHGLKICGKGCIKELQFTHNKNMLSPDGQKAILSYLLEKREAYKAGFMAMMRLTFFRWMW